MSLGKQGDSGVVRSPLVACRSALLRGLLLSAPGSVVDAKGYVADAGLNLIEGVRLHDFEVDLKQGDGDELAGKFRAAHSSSALAVNAFGPFKAHLPALRLLGLQDFDTLNFERKCPHGIAGRRPPNLDVVAAGLEGVVAIESKCLEFLAPHKAKFAPAYEEKIQDGRRSTGWYREMLSLIESPASYRWLDAAQLIKHAFGIAHTFPTKRANLLYVFWEPANASEHPIFREHRDEIARFAARVRGEEPDGPLFRWMPYTELWKAWEGHEEPEWLQEHARRLRVRYEVRI